MTVHVALLRAVNVGGTRLLPMKDLAALCTGLGLQAVRTYIQSGNVVFESRLGEARLRAALEAALTERLGRPADVAIRSAAQLRAALESCPFAEPAPPARVGIAFLQAPPAKRVLAALAIPGDEELRPGARELYIHYPQGMGKSKLKLPAALGPATVRTLNTVTRLVELTEA